MGTILPTRFGRPSWVIRRDMALDVAAEQSTLHTCSTRYLDTSTVPNAHAISKRDWPSD